MKNLDKNIKTKKENIGVSITDELIKNLVSKGATYTIKSDGVQFLDVTTIKK
tara:strand:- start:439 stop:594 length:156 start_codon:yes stop_codon:yes gene_type:complete